jgi:DNA-binding transcriptional MerR regulator
MEAEHRRYRIQAVAEMTGIPTGTLRAWERRYGVPCPDRSTNRYRLYGAQQVAAVRAMARRLAEGMAPSEAAAWVRARQERGESLEDAVLAPPPELVEDAFQRGAQGLVSAARAFDPARLESALQAVLLLGSAFDVFFRALAPALVLLGDQWAAGLIGVGEEHLATAFIAASVRDLVRLVQPGPSSPRVLLACVAGESHEVGLYGAALQAARAGWSSTILGAQTPPNALAEVCRGMAPAAVGLSVTVPVSDGDPEALFARYGEACAEIPWFVGGHAAGTYAGVIQGQGGQVVTDVHALPELLNRLRPKPR